MHRSRLDMRGADAGAGGMSISSGSGGASGMGASSSSVASAMAQSTGSSGAGSGSTCLAKSSSWAWSAAASVTASRKPSLLSARSWRHPVLQTLSSAKRSAIARDAHSAEGRRHAFAHGQAVECAINDGAGKSGARLRLDAALEVAEDGHVAGLQVRRALWREEAQHDARECGPHGCQCGLAGVDAGHVPEEDPRLSLPAWVEHVIQGGRELQDGGGRGPAVL